MSILMLVVILAVVMCVGGAGVVAFALGNRQLRPPSAPVQNPRLAEQDERIELLEDELRRVRDQADFTERLLTERGDAQPGDAQGDTQGDTQEDGPD